MDQEAFSDYLEHYGVKGMRWGVINKEDRVARAAARAEKKTTRRTARVDKLNGEAGALRQTNMEMDKLGIRHPELRKMYGRAIDQNDKLFRVVHGKTKEKAVRDAQAENLKKANRLESDAKAVKEGRLTRNQKIAIIGGAAAVAVIGTYAALNYRDLMTMRAKAGEPISEKNFLKKYSKRSLKTYLGDKYKKQTFDQLDDNDVTLSAGTTFRRMTTDPNEALDKRHYVTHTPADNDRYQGIYGPSLRMRSNTPDLYINEYKMKSEIRSPSEKKRVQAFIDLINDPTIGPSGDSFRGQVMELELKNFGLNGAMGKGNGLSLSNEEYAIIHYRAFAGLQHHDTEANARYFAKIKEMGYNALVDDNDAGQLSDSPMILLDMANDVAQKATTKLTPNMEKEARKRLVELLDPEA